jgi:glyoxylate reductase/D-3-phosphoglycerate dehydrogenase
MTNRRRPVLVIEDDAFTRIAGIVLDPDTPTERRDAYAEFFEHDLPDFDGWLQRVRKGSAGFYPAEVRLIDTQEELLENLPDADALLIESLELGQRELDAGKRLRLVQKFGTVLRGIDVAACQASGVTVRTHRRRANVGCAEHTLALLLTLTRKLHRIGGRISIGRLQEAGYQPKVFDPRVTANSGWARVTGLRMLYESTLGIVGMGEIGRELALMAAPFGMRVLYYQRTQLPEDEERALQIEYASLEELLGASDYVSIHLPGNDSTRGLIDATRLSQMKPGAFLINISRPQIVDRAALLDSLRSGHLGGFALDTLYEVPGRDDDELLGFDNVFLTPWTAAQPRFNALNDLEEMITGMAAALR